MSNAETPADGQPDAAQPGSGEADAPIVARNSRFKLVALALPCLAVTAISIYGAVGGLSELGGNVLTQLAVAAVGGLTGFVVLQMAFDRRPMLVIDEKGITSTRPDTGTIPWHAIAGIGITKSVMLRKVLLIAVDEDELDEKARRHLSRRTGLGGLLSPQVAHFQGQMAGRPMISIPIAYLDISVRTLRRLLDEKISYHG